MHHCRKKAAVAVAALLGSLSTQAHATDAGLSVWWTDFSQHVHVQTGPTNSIEASAQFGGTILYDGRGVGLDYVAGLNLVSGVIPVSRVGEGSAFVELARASRNVGNVLAQYTGTPLYDGRGVGLVHVAGVDQGTDVEPAISYSQEAAYTGFWANSVRTEALADYGSTHLYDGRGVGLQMASLDAGMIASTAGW